MFLERFQEKIHSSPHDVLGLHLGIDGKKVIRLWRPGAENIYLKVFGSIVQAKKIDSKGLFEYEVPEKTEFRDYRVYHQNGLLASDPYAFGPIFGELDKHLFAQGVHYRLYEVMGGKVSTHQGIAGVKFTVWAPNAKWVSLVGDFNHWDGRVNPMRSYGGIWELFIPGIGNYQKYKFEIHTDGEVFLKTDPYANYCELRPANASIVFDVDRYEWQDQVWREKQLKRNRDSYPLNIYEVHLGSWKKRDGHYLNYREMAFELAQYCNQMGFSHVELLPITEYPLDESWGYQVTGFFAPTSRFGTPEDFQYFVDYLHQQNIGVILDWVPAHFPLDSHSLHLFDGTCLYEHKDIRQGYHPHWSTCIFNYGRFEVSNFLIASALFWLDKMHVDGFRVDAVASMLYLDYGREAGEWIPNAYGGRENLAAIEFIKHLNSIVHQLFPFALMCAEESTSFTGVTHSLEKGGLGFNLKWNMGWMNDSLQYFSKNPLFRSYHQNILTFSLLYAFSEKFILPLSHDEVVHGKANLLSKMPGDDWRKFANVRLFYSCQICYPGKKLVFMGVELGVWKEWNSQEELPWGLLAYERHQMLQRFFQQMNAFYQKNFALWQWDFDSKGFEWIDFSDQKNCCISYLRKAEQQLLFCVHNFSANCIPNYVIHLLNVVRIKEVFNTDKKEYGGSGKLNSSVEIMNNLQKKPIGVQFQLSPLATMIFEVQFVC
ncbi:alpha-glucan branching enzyme GlgB [Candidatus Rhabdochlamydia oedothoracis]|uniref:1,4-alpha-glucan branching enzyme GlgB n=1 Tax=Candidatus Rhabdochlamydia oedothoracis TaxID=2720720 RepID=A0ABX8V1W1_9BACT|nr:MULTISPECIES: 1,4-alpha-glucan branching protein GlgB [Rhabdochlamydia]KAG6559608.1 1,4-alpha-glucan branching enzyme GlgB [Candidatus Rhabdochlamydia sp. W815]MCL6756369.1 1,4-alpha-glucan branching protein GlgB [Candidatus Rhabdochlamydia oedothoracis]QYF48502.1 alpha-glucan branching enzyme GlgB [Candidatus Rhabdochlamydia oedothoracis]